MVSDSVSGFGFMVSESGVSGSAVQRLRFTWSEAAQKVVLREASVPLSPVWREAWIVSPSTELMPVSKDEV